MGVSKILNNKFLASIYTFIFIFFSIYSYSQSQNRKIYISPFEYKSDDSGYKYFDKSLPRSIRTTISRAMAIEMGDGDLSSNELKDRGFQFYIKGMYKVTETEIFVTFSLIYSQTNKAVLIAFAHGAKQGLQIFDMIDGISKLVVETLNKPLSQILAKTLILSVDKSGQIKQSTESLAGLDLSGGIFTGADLSGRDLTDANLSNADLTRVNLTNAILIRTNFENAILDRTIFNSANIENANFKNVKQISIYNNLHATKNLSQAKFDSYAKNIITTPSIYAGFYIGPGLSYNQYQLSVGGDLYSRITGHASARFMFKSGFNFALFADIGYHALRALEKDPLSSFKVSHDLHYLYVSLGPLLMIKDFMFYSGLIFNFLLKGIEYKGCEKTTSSDKDIYNKFNIGFVIGAMFKYYSYKSFDLTIGIDLKYQIINFLTNFSGENYIFSYYLSLGILFSL